MRESPRHILQMPTEAEIAQITKAVSDLDVDQIAFGLTLGSPWLSVNVMIFMNGEKKYALWRTTGAVYNVGPDGAVEDDPFIEAAWEIDHLVCSHADVEMLRSAQLADDEIQIMVVMIANGRCPLCHPEHHVRYVEAVERIRRG